MLTELQVKNAKPRNSCYVVCDDKEFCISGLNHRGASIGFFAIERMTRSINIARTVPRFITKGSSAKA